MNDKVMDLEPATECVVRDRLYKVSIVIEGTQNKQKQLVEDIMTSSQEQSILPDRSLAIDPFYDSNPELKCHPDG